MTEMRGTHRVLDVKYEGKKPLGNPGADGMIILRWTFRKSDVGVIDWIEPA
jgi:hypothetical protein